MKKFSEIFTGIAKNGNDQKTHSCCGGNEHVHQHVNNSQSEETIYQCPMKCEGDKTYSKPGRCPVCGMNLASVKN